MSNIAETEGKWYVIHTYSGYENKVLTSITKMVENMGLQDYIFDVKIPVEEVMEVKNERRKLVQRKLFPSYVMIKMIMTKQTLYLIRNTRGVTGFVGPGSKVPIPLTNEEVRRMGLENVRVKFDIAAGDVVDIITGPFEGYQGVVDEVDDARQKVRIKVELFNRENVIELDFIHVKKV
ncbi:MAG: transcription termination/antitermination factor NusG [Clostridia bacterium]|nr:transcription termination/antitermination factor NusG [Clostridia bacterium]